MPEYSLVIPVYNEADSLEILFAEICLVMKHLGCSFEIIFVDDASSDGSPDKLETFRSLPPAAVKIIKLTQHSGQTYALRQGLNAAQGKIAVTLDADLQNDPQDIPKLFDKMEEGYDAVCGWRKDRRDRLLKKKLSKFGNLLQRQLTGLAIHDVSCTLRAYRKDCLRQIDLEWEGQHRFIPLSLHQKGFRIGEIVLNHRDRKFGVSKYKHRRIFKVIVDFCRIHFR